MTHLTEDLTWWMLRLGAAVASLDRRARDERGDVPGWVMITVMSATIVAALSAFAVPQLQGMLRSALNSVK